MARERTERAQARMQQFSEHTGVALPGDYGELERLCDLYELGVSIDWLLAEETDRLSMFANNVAGHELWLRIHGHKIITGRREERH